MTDLIGIRTQLRTLAHLKQFHAQLIYRSLHADDYWLTVLLGHCTRLRAPPRYARRLFDAAPRPNAHVFTAMFKFHSQLGFQSDAAAIFTRMRDLGIQPDAFVFTVLLKLAGSVSVATIHAHVLRMGCAGDRYVRNAVMDGYAKRGPLENAQRLFDEIPDKVVPDWNLMISGCWRWGNEQEAVRLFDLMQERSVVSWTAMVSGYAKLGDLGRARLYFEVMPERTVVAWNAMLSGYSQNNMAEEALKFFANMIEAGVQPDETTWVTIVASCSSKGDLRLAETLVGMLEKRQVKLNCFVKTALVDMFAKCGDLARAKQIFYGMTNRNVVSWNAMISGQCRAGDLHSARHLFDTMPAKNVISWNSMISGYVQNGQWETAINLFKLMLQEKHEVKPDEISMVSVVSACGHLGALETGRWVISVMDECQVKPTNSAFNALIFMYSRCGSMSSAKEIFQRMPVRDTFSYNSLLTGLATYGLAYEALELMKEMEREDVKPDRITYITVLTACSHAGLLEEGRCVFQKIINPTVDHYACMIDLLGRAGKLHEAKSMIDNMPIRPHAGVYGSLLNASCMYKQVELGEIAAQKLFALEPENSGNYILMANLYASAKRWNDVERVRLLMKQRGISKTTGCSWVEFNGKVFRFVAGDQPHHQSDEIKKILENIRKKIKCLGYVADKDCVLRDVEEEEKEEMVGVHSEKLALAFALLVTDKREPIRIVKNLRICDDCHMFMKVVSKLEGREILVRDNNRFHSFKDAECSCKDYW